MTHGFVTATSSQLVSPGIRPEISWCREEFPSPLRKRCGDIWGGKCNCWVYAPDYAHDYHPNRQSKIKAAQQRTLCTAVLLSLVEDPDPQVRSALAANPSSPAQMMTTLAFDPEWPVRAAVASNTITHSEILDILATDTCLQVRLAVAGNPTTSAAALATLAHHACRNIRHRVAHHRATPPQVLALLAADIELEIQAAALRHPFIPDHVRVVTILGNL